MRKDFRSEKIKILQGVEGVTLQQRSNLFLVSRSLVTLHCLLFMDLFFWELVYGSSFNNFDYSNNNLYNCVMCKYLIRSIQVMNFITTIIISYLDMVQRLVFNKCIQMFFCINFRLIKLLISSGDDWDFVKPNKLQQELALLIIFSIGTNRQQISQRSFNSISPCTRIIARNSELAQLYFPNATMALFHIRPCILYVLFQTRRL